ncbi:non-ribosomal peptide synthetase [Dactylosporangium sp. NPDC051485]|uniref:non-ribosomal peptide synthetase n=1 Tax=Dactylosporangium sp. NPDC051485 TaxID=3154846 RepID=UPI0034427A90
MSRRPRPAAVTVADLIWQHADTAPDRVAVIDATGAAVTYQQLTRSADAVAAHLTTVGVSADEVVGVCWPRSVDGLVQLLGVWRAGGAVLYLDPAWPDRRLQYMAATCAVRHVRAADTAPHIPAGATMTRIGAGAGAGLDPVRGPLAYVVFTSGSTGTPNGVLIEHPGVVNMAQALAERFDVHAGTPVLQLAAWSWDAAMCEILLALTAGGTLVLAPEDTRTGGDALARWLRKHRVEVATLTPSVLAALPATSLPDLRTVVAVGEPCHPRLVQRWSTPARQLFNGYGPTEATVAVTVGQLHPGQDVHIGAPLPGVTVRIVDPDGRILPTGVTGELLVGGVGVARGYAANPAATAARFTTDRAGRRWYHTGDLAAWRTDGTLTYHGRRDDQIKLRGHRLTLGEVEHVLASHPAVLACAVVAVADRLTAFVAADYHDGPPGTGLATELRAHAAAVLPPFAVPDIRVVPALPLTAGGKTDREALRAQADPRPAPNDDAANAGGSLPTVLRVVAAAVDLPVHPETDIVAAGGHSLLVAQLCVALSEELSVEVPYVLVATNPSPATIAAAIDDLTTRPHSTVVGDAA